MELNFNLIGTFRLLGRPNDEHLEVKHESLPPAQAIVASSSDDEMQILVVVKSCDMATALLDIMAVYFVFNIAFITKISITPFWFYFCITFLILKTNSMNPKLKQFS